jgi:hypothetical protein
VRRASSWSVLVVMGRVVVVVAVRTVIGLVGVSHPLCGDRDTSAETAARSAAVQITAVGLGSGCGEGVARG